VDLQPVFLNTVSDQARLIRRCSFAIEAAQGLGLNVVFTEQVPQKLGATDPKLLALAKNPRQLGKASFSALADHGIRDALLQRCAADHLIIIGIETPICIYQTAIDAIRADIPVTLLNDCLDARRTEDAAAALAALRHAGAHVLPSETVFYSMLGDTNHPFFRGYTQLVKKYA
jgi:nicotinamidase-related amidase